jgi:NifU-like protein involved in Fe-S cluster formation
MYTNQVAEHIANPRNVGEIEDPSGTGDVVNQVCMDRMRLTIRLEGDRLVDARIKAQGCPPTIAAASVLTELIIGRTLGELEALTRKEITDALGRLPPAKSHCAALALEALRAAVEDSRRRFFRGDQRSDGTASQEGQ